jgi:hypothetical protein
VRSIQDAEVVAESVYVGAPAPYHPTIFGCAESRLWSDAQFFRFPENFDLPYRVRRISEF